MTYDENPEAEDVAKGEIKLTYHNSCTKTSVSDVMPNGKRSFRGDVEEMVLVGTPIIGVQMGSA